MSSSCRPAQIARCVAVLVTLVASSTRAQPQVPPDGLPESDPRPVMAVTSAQELVAAIGSDRIIELAAGQYLIGYLQMPPGEFPTYNIEEFPPVFPHDPMLTALTIHDVQNLTIRGPAPADGPGPHAELVQDGGAAWVLRFVDVQTVSIENIIAGHGERVEECTGGVLSFEDSSGIRVSGARLYGSGSVGVGTRNVSGLRIENTTITGCSYGALFFDQSSAIHVAHSSLVDNGPTYWATVSLQSGAQVSIESTLIQGNNADQNPIFAVDEASNLTVIDSTITGNSATALTSAPERTLVSGGSVTQPTGAAAEGGPYDWAATVPMGAIAPSLAMLRGDVGGPDDTPALILSRIEYEDPQVDAIPEVACWRATPHECPSYMVPAPPELLAAVTAPADISLITQGGMCRPTMGEPQLVAYVRGCESYFLVVSPLSGCPAPVAPIYLAGGGMPIDLTWTPAVDGPVEEPLSATAPSDPLHQQVVTAWLAANPLPPAPLIETRALRRVANPGLETIETFFAAANIHHNADECSNEPRSLEATGLRTGQGDWHSITESGLLVGVASSGGQAMLIVFDDAGYVRAFRRTGPTSFEPWFDGSYFDENDECQWFGSPIAYPYPCGP